MKQILKTVISLAVGCVVTLAASSSQAEIRDTTLRMAIANYDGSAQYAGAMKIAELVSQKSGGKMKVKVYSGGQLGKDVAVLSSMQGGIIDMGILSTSLMVGIVKEVGLLDLPFIFASEKEAWAVMDGPFGKKLNELFVPKGLVNLSYFELGYYHMLSTKRPITKWEDFEGQKMRVMETPVSIETMTTMGANAVPIPYPELYMAFDQKIVDGAGQPLINILTVKFYEVQKYLSLTGHVYSPQSVLIGKKSWDKLNAEEKQVLESASQEAAVYQRNVSLQKASEALSLLKSKLTVNEISPVEMTRMREKVRPLNDKFSKQIGEKMAAEMFAEIAKYRTAHK